MTLNNTGLVTTLEDFVPICSYYSGVVKQSRHIRQQCQRYENSLNSILKMGYRLDKSIIPKKHTHRYNGKEHTCRSQSTKETYYDPVLTEKYRTKLFSLDNLRKQITEEISREKVKARRSYNVEYHEKLIRKNVIKLFPDDDIFIADHQKVYADANNPRYIKMVENKNEELLSKKQREQLAQERKEDENLRKREESEWRSLCSYLMTSELHNDKGNGFLSGSVTSADKNGYFVDTAGGNYYVRGGPLHTRGEFVDRVPVSSSGKNVSTINTNRTTGVKTSDAVHEVVYNRECER